MDQLAAVPSPSPPTDAPSAPVFPALPTTTAKNVTRVILVLSSALVGVGGWYAKEVEVDPEMAQVIAERVNVPGLVTAGTGILGICLSLFQAKQQTDQAHVAVAAAAAALPVDPEGNASVEHSLNMTLTQASAHGRRDVARKILDLLDSLEPA